MNEKLKNFLPLLLMAAILAAFLLPKRLEQKACNNFGAPLFEHALPEGTKVVQQTAVKDDEGGVTAALLLQTELTPETLKAFYADTDYPPMKEGQTVTLSAKELDEASMDALKQAKLYEDGASYRFVYLYCK